MKGNGMRQATDGTVLVLPTRRLISIQFDQAGMLTNQVALVTRGIRFSGAILDSSIGILVK